MMKIFLILVLSISAFHALGDNSSGCGLGWRVTKSMTTSGSATRNLTNATFSNTFAMTSGTSGCEYHSIVKIDKNRIHFVEANLLALNYEVAIGQGERLEAANVVFGCQNNQMQQFTKILKKNASHIFGSHHNPAEVVSRIEQVISSDATLGVGCII